MNVVVLSLVLFTFTTGVIGLLIMIWAVSNNRMKWGPGGAQVIFEKGELGHVEDPAGAATDVSKLARSAHPTVIEERRPNNEDAEARRTIDQSGRRPVMVFIISSLAWLLFGSLLGLVASLKMTFPDWLTGSAPLTFGRIRPMHLNSVIYGWASMAGMAVALWLMPRLVRAPLRGGSWAMAGALCWNIGMALGLSALAFGWTDGLEWLEFPWPIDVLFVVGGALAGLPILLTLRAQRTSHLYVSVWYLAAAFVWFPILFIIGNVPYVHFGVEHATVNWWYAHNVLGLWLTPFGLAIAYYFIPKILGVPVYSYGLSLIGFWSLALFYSQVGTHHLIGGPIPTWLISVSIVHSIMMVIPVTAVGINHHMTMKGRFSTLKHSPTLRFVVTGALIYTAVSLEGSFQALRSINRITHFTHFTVAHAHLGVYAFVSMELFGALYFLMPRVLEREWPYPKLIYWHFWLSLGGVMIYVVGLSIGGLLQGLAMADATKPFTDSVTVTRPYLHARSLGGLLMMASHLLFAAHVGALMFRGGPQRSTAPWAPPAPAREVS